MTEASRCFTHSPSQVYPERKQSINTISVPPQISYLYDPAGLILAQMQRWESLGILINSAGEAESLLLGVFKSARLKFIRHLCKPVVPSSTAPPGLLGSNS